MPSFACSCVITMIFCGTLVAASCAAQTLPNPVAPGDTLSPCPDSPNCVASGADDEQHKIAPLTFAPPAAEAWQRLLEQVAKLPRATIVSEKPGYLHVECRSKIFGFVDDLEFQLQAAQGLIAVRSASRTGYYDFGVNRRRVEALRAALSAAQASR
ncbi:MAG: DUF1499 domain-containing protein [Desulfuromonadales bacterium]|jgi:uncharacterized protein (DUF1499 family)